MASTGAWTVRPGFNEYTFSYMNRNWQPDQMIGKGHKKEAYSVVCLNDASDEIREKAKTIAALFMPVETDTEKADFFREVSILYSLTGVPNTSNLLHHSLDSQNGVGLIVTNKFSECLDTWASEKDLPSKLHMLLQIAKTVRKIHKHGIAHCDLKPTNIGVENNQCIIADFGSAESDVWEDDIPKQNGTPAYSPPLKSDLTFYQKDIFSLGVIIYELCQPQVRPQAFFKDIINCEVNLDSTLKYLNETKWVNIVKVIVNSPVNFLIQSLLIDMLIFDQTKILTLDKVIMNLERLVNSGFSRVPPLCLSKVARNQELTTSESKDGENTQRWHPGKRPPTKIPPPKCAIETKREVVAEVIDDETELPPYVPETARGSGREETDAKRPQNLSQGTFQRMRTPAPLRSRTPNALDLLIDDLTDGLNIEGDKTLTISTLEIPPFTRIGEKSEIEEKGTEKLSLGEFLRIRSPAPIRSHAR